MTARASTTAPLLGADGAQGTPQRTEVGAVRVACLALPQVVRELRGARLELVVIEHRG